MIIHDDEEYLQALVRLDYFQRTSKSDYSESEIEDLMLAIREYETSTKKDDDDIFIYICRKPKRKK